MKSTRNTVKSASDMKLKKIITWNNLPISVISCLASYSNRLWWPGVLEVPSSFLHFQHLCNSRERNRLKTSRRKPLNSRNMNMSVWLCHSVTAFADQEPRNVKGIAFRKSRSETEVLTIYSWFSSALPNRCAMISRRDDGCSLLVTSLTILKLFCTFCTFLMVEVFSSGEKCKG